MENKIREEIEKRFEILEDLGLDGILKKHFLKTQEPVVVETLPFLGRGSYMSMYSNINCNKQWKEAVERVEAKGNKVYLITLDDTDFGTLLNMFCVSKYEEEWDRDKEKMKNKEDYVWVENLTHTDCSEYGNIYFKISDGCIFRIA